MKLELGLWVPLIERKKPIVCGGGQRSQGVTGGQNLKTLCTGYLKKGNFSEAQNWSVGTPYKEEEAYCFWWRSKVTGVVGV